MRSREKAEEGDEAFGCVHTMERKRKERKQKGKRKEEKKEKRN